MSMLVGLAEIAQRLREAPQVVVRWHYFTGELPPPDAVIDTEPLWDLGTIDAWAAERAAARFASSVRQHKEAVL